MFYTLERRCSTWNIVAPLALVRNEVSNIDIHMNTIETVESVTSPVAPVVAKEAKPAKAEAKPANAVTIPKFELKQQSISKMQTLLSVENLANLADLIVRTNESSARVGDFFKKHGTPVAGTSFKGAATKCKRIVNFGGYEVSEADWKAAPDQVKLDVRILSAFSDAFAIARIAQTIVK